MVLDIVPLPRFLHVLGQAIAHIAQPIRVRHACTQYISVSRYF